MAGSYDGSIRIDTSINSASLESGLNNIENKAKSLATAIGLAFGTKELIEFGKKSVDAASDLVEAQNVVDTAFGAMSYKMEQFAATALETYGISELTAKQMGSTYMAMAKGMNVASGAASDMAVTLTGRLSDIMSFYNKTQSEVDTIGRALITGETEPLKAIGVVMTQTNLAAYAMAQGFSKTYTEMSANEQLLVRYKYFLEQTALAQGDFANTSESWANQTRLLSERINQFMTNLGSVIINVLTPALQFANEAVTFLNELFFGGNDSAEDTAAAKNAAAITDEVTSMGSAAEKSEKKLNSLIAGFDELHVISGAKSDEDDTADAGIDTSNLLGVNLDADTSTAKKAASKYREIINEIYLAFKNHPLTKIIEKMISDIGKFFGFVEDKGGLKAGKIVDTLMDILGAFLAFKSISGIVSGIGLFNKGFSGLIGIITAHPVGAAVVGLTALAVGIYALDKELERQQLARNFGDISISLEEIGELINPITRDIDKVADAFADNKERLQTAKDNFINIAKAVDRTADAFKNGKLEQNVESFSKQIDEFVSSALSVNSATFDTSPYEALFIADDGVIDDEEQKILDRMRDFGGTIEDKINSTNAKIQSIVQTAIQEERDLLENELEDIQRLYNEIARMTQMQEEVKTSATWERLKNGAYSYDSYAELAEQIKAAQEQAAKSREATQQTAYEDILMRLNVMRENGLSDEEYEQLKKEWLDEVDESIKAMELEANRYERDIVMAFAEGAFTDMAKAWREGDPEGQERLKQYFDLLRNMPDDFDLSNVFSRLSLGDAEDLQAAYSILGEIEEQFGIDIPKEVQRLNEAIGDTGKNTEDFFISLQNILGSVQGLEVDSLLPKIEDFEKYPDEYSRILAAWVEYSKYTVSVGVEINTEEADKFLNDYISTRLGIETNSPYYSFQPSDFVGPQLPPSGLYTPEIKVEIPVNIDNEYKGTIAQSSNNNNFEENIIHNGR